MSVQIEPAELGFQRPFNTEITRSLRIRNPNSNMVAFKVKTTAPKQYCVRPNSGRIDPGGFIDVSISLQAMRTEPPPDAKCRDKFLVQSVGIAPEADSTNVQAIWDNVDKNDIKEKKIRVSYLSADGEPATPAAATPSRRGLPNGGVDGTPDVPPPAYSSPPPDTDMPSSASSHDPPTREAPPVPGDRPSSAAADITALEVQHDSDADVRLRKAASAAAAAVSEKSRHASAVTQQAVRRGTEGVPVKVVAVLCLISFLIAYFFF